MREGFLSIKGVLAIVGVLSALLLAAGCGSDEGDATGSSGGGEVTVETGSLSKAEFVKQVSAICTKSREQLQRQVAAFLEERNNNPAKPSEGSAEVEFLEETYLPGYEQQIDEVSAIGAPAGDEEQVAAFLQAMQDWIDRAAAEPEAFTAGELSLDRAAKLAKAYGFKNCAEL
jgi:hypothetical protein